MMHCSSLNYSLIGHLNSFQFFIITHNAVMNMLVNKPFSIVWILSLRQVPRSEITGSKITTFLCFLMHLAKLLSSRAAGITNIAATDRNAAVTYCISPVLDFMQFFYFDHFFQEWCILFFFNLDFITSETDHLSKFSLVFSCELSFLFPFKHLDISLNNLYKLFFTLMIFPICISYLFQMISLVCNFF